MNDTPSKPSLRRAIGLPTFVLYGVGNIIGAGIYVLVGKVAGEAGMLAPFAFLLAAFIAVFTGLSYGELSARYPVSAGEAVYIERAFGRRQLSIAVGLLIAAAGLVSAATMARGFVGYFNVFVDVSAWMVIVPFVAVLTLVASRGIAASAGVAALLTLIEVGGLVWIIGVAGPNLPALADLPAPQILPLNAAAWQGVLAGAFLAFFAFIGFEDMVNIAEEVKRPERTLPLGIVLAFIVSTILYLAVALVSIATLTTAELAASEAPLADVYATATQSAPTLISVIGLVAVINGALIQIIMAARIFYGMSVNGWLPGFLGHVSAGTRTPILATAIAGVVVLLFALALPIISLARSTSLMVLIVFTLINVSLIRIKRRHTPPAGVRLLPMWVPVFGAVASALIILSSLFDGVAD